MTDPECVALLQWALPRLGLRWRGFAHVRGQVCKRLSRRARALGLTAAGYQARLAQDPAELRHLDGLCRVTISRFFRDRAVYEHLRDRLLPGLARAALARGARLEAWSAGCASGEEPYTLAVLLRLGLPGLPFHILATDADPALLERARRACYPGGSLRELPPRWREEAFEPRGGGYCLRPAFQAGVELARQDLREQLPAGPFDLILCRNLAFTYFGPELQRRVLAELEQRLVPGGALVIGGHEALPEGSGLRPEAPPLPVFRRPGEAVLNSGAAPLQI